MSSDTIENKYRSRYTSTKTAGSSNITNLLGVFNKTIISLALVGDRATTGHKTRQLCVTVLLTEMTFNRKFVTRLLIKLQGIKKQLVARKRVTVLRPVKCFL